MTCARELAWVLNGIGHPEDASAVLGRGDRGRFRHGHHRPGAPVRGPAALRSTWRGRTRSRRAWSPTGSGSSPGRSAHRLWLAVEAWRLMLVGEDARQAAELARRALDGWQIFAEQPTSPIPSQLVLVLVVAEDFEFAERALEVMLAGARAIGSAPLEAASLGLRSELEFRRGMIAGAAADARTAIEIARAHAFIPAMPLTISWITQALIERGELAEAERELELSWNGGPGAGPHVVHAHPPLPRDGRARPGQGAIGRSRTSWRSAAARRAAKQASSRGIRMRPSYWRRSASKMRPQRLAEQGLERARRWGTAGRVGHATRALGLVAGGDDGIEHLREAVRAAPGSPAGLEYMRALTDFGAALRRAGRRADAREPLREALELARRAARSRSPGARTRSSRRRERSCVH